MKRIFLSLSLIVLALLISSWGSKGHKRISTNFVQALPSEMGFLQPVWTKFVTDHAMDPDYRKSEDPSESAKHYIDIDNYPEFVANGKITQDYDSAILQHGFPFVWEQGILPWAILATYDSLRNCFERGDWNRSAQFAADLGHYVGDGHMPLHITRNYNGQYTGQSGIHSRYESSMISRYESMLLYDTDPAEYISNVKGYVFAFIYLNNRYVDSILLADTYARQSAGSTSGDAYYTALWQKSGAFTVDLMKRASFSLASLIYTAWVEAGQPVLSPNAIHEESLAESFRVLPVFPNPSTGKLFIPVVVNANPEQFLLGVYDQNGMLVNKMDGRFSTPGHTVLEWDLSGLNPGVYHIFINKGDEMQSRKLVIAR